MVATVGRIRRLTPEGLNSSLETETEARVAYYASYPERIEQRLRELDEEWDVERAIELEAAGTVLVGVILGTIVNKKWYLLSAFAGAMLVLHNLHGQYPLLPLFRRLKVRTPHEIEQERYALKAVRGDFDQVSKGNGKHQARNAFAAADPPGVSSAETITPPA